MVGRVKGPAEETSRAPNADEYREVIGHFASGVTVITTAVDEERFGTTASAVTSLTVEPPQLLVCLNRESTTGQAIDRAGYFVVNILTEEQRQLAGRFATKEANKFDTDVELHPEFPERPLLHGSLAHLECRVNERVESATHVIFIGLVEAAIATEKPLAYYRGQFGRLDLTGAD